ncbi:MAG: N-acetyltransferase [Candidatus Microbacterium phytovorans]|uniref:N-acetyltransferase n=1 Tax=Candidatus Microbacterium phytovorans TaxID=3121374 RepID=A0AAJ6B2Z1_9MICO|nr:N-acetyltransferase [Microbacterium sp.]WEK12472.1 MAG: N-acetyltransferase [Microbacterium sp.]
MPRIRPFRPGDEPALAEICLRTADAGGDATGVFDDDDLWAEVFVLPYVSRHPDLAFVVEDDAGTPRGYVVGTPDTRAFEDWFATQWWPRFAARWPRPDSERTRQDGTLIYAYGRRAGAEPYGDDHPAHLHIDLLPELQGQGWGRRLIDTLADALRERGVPGLHLVASSDNTGALAFYTRLGFAPLPSHAGVQAFAKTL